MTTKTQPTRTVTLNCGHQVTYAIPAGQLGLPFELDPDHAWTCVECFRWHTYEGVRYVVDYTDSDPEPEPTPDATTEAQATEEAAAEQRPAKPAPTATCRRCRATLRSARSVARGVGPVCEREERREAAVEAAGFKAAAVAKARELIEQGGILPLRGRRVFTVVSSDGSARYLTAPQACNCVAGLKARHACYHRVAATLLAA